ncbi:hypothetical protein DUNSADRAFT_2060 [Dunaliella salina]|uniref:Encoded protein n=1 Tax=Dunaliella salina TaxID=3046 RepID=A0ABQ7FWP2_DUNSA|nr:hypothetical protein DUNSADRAFT_2060 [Dunaliella salina]|eukprot:KAF5826788.1 hypothetical protein DUNSADRAFT_2060 [Dunaliella salina]
MPAGTDVHVPMGANPPLAAASLGGTVGQHTEASVHPSAAMEEKNPSCNLGNSSCAAGEDNKGSGHAEERGAPAHPQISSLIPGNKQLQRNSSSNRRTKKGAPVPMASGSPKDCSTSDEETNGQLGKKINPALN